MGCHLLKVLVPAVISASLLWEGIQCRADGYSLRVPSHVTVQDGLCAHISCSFTYHASHYDPHARLYGFWYVEDKDGGSPHLVATNNAERSKGIDRRFRGRFEVSETKLNQGDCSLTIRDAAAADQAKYQFRVEKGHNGYSFSEPDERLSLVVTERKLDITFVGPLRAGQRESLFCQTPRCSSLAVPKITWTDVSQLSILENVGDRLDFNATAADHRRNVTCRVTYGEGSRRRSAEKTVSLNIHYPPRILPFSGKLRYSSEFVQNFANVSELEARVSDSLLVRCEADANPEGQQIWVRTPHSSRTGEHVSDNEELTVLGLRLQDQGEYVCEATNQEGSSQASFSLRVTGSDYEYNPGVKG